MVAMERKGQNKSIQKPKKNKEITNTTSEDKKVDESESLQALVLSAKTNDVVLFTKHSQNIPNVVQKFMDDGKALIHWAAISGSSGILVELLNLGAEVDFPDSKGYTALHFSIIWNQIECSKVLLAKGANSRTPTGNGETATDISRRYKNWLAWEILEKLESSQPQDADVKK